ncbi:hypothetical protein [Zobellia nedashkovskayae]|uniref:hypothetical protein n=1 Tax=Zobellia nedashkovskayae TaxID=2779510 RepID=UPI00188A9F80|nr:hypothetical protein [Zobellia nedashkovskayae]
MLLITNSIYTQTDTSIYSSDTMYTLLESKEGKVVKKVPFGKEVTITFDYFFKTLNIDYKNIDREYVHMSFDILHNVQNKVLIVKDDFDNEFSGMNTLDSNGELYLISNIPNEDETLFSIKIINAMKIN